MENTNTLKETIINIVSPYFNNPITKETRLEISTKLTEEIFVSKGITNMEIIEKIEETEPYAWLVVDKETGAETPLNDYFNLL